MCVAERIGVDSGSSVCRLFCEGMVWFCGWERCVVTDGMCVFIMRTGIFRYQRSNEIMCWGIVMSLA